MILQPFICELTLFVLFSTKAYKSAYLKIIFLISQPKHMLWVLKRTVSSNMFKQIDKKIITILRLTGPMHMHTNIQ